MNTRSVDPRVKRIVELFEQLEAADLDRLDRFYSSGARFKDPFNDVCGVDAISDVFGHMFNNLDRPRFVIKDTIVADNQCFLSWEFRFAMKRFARGEQTVRGASHLSFDTDGLICIHRDYWDAAEELYEKLPLIGTLMRWLKRRVSS